MERELRIEVFEQESKRNIVTFYTVGTEDGLERSERRTLSERISESISNLGKHDL